MIGLDFDDDTADTVDQQRRADQVACHFMHAAGEKKARLSGRPSFGRAGLGTICSGGNVTLGHSIEGQQGRGQDEGEGGEIRREWRYVKVS